MFNKNVDRISACICTKNAATLDIISIVLSHFI